MTATATPARPLFRRLLPVGLVLLLLLVLGWGGWRLWLRHERRAALDLAATDFNEAEPRLKRLANRQPGDPEVLGTLTRGYLAAGQLDDAETYLDRWVSECGSPTAALQRRMELRQKQKRDADALVDGRILVERDPDDVELRLKVASLCFATGAIDEAGEHCEKALEVEPDRLDARRLLANVRQNQGRWREAANLVDQLLKEQPDSTAFLMSRAVVYLGAGEPKQAIPLLERVIKLDPRRQRTARYQLALAYDRAGRPEDARRIKQELSQLQEAEVLGDALQSQPDNPDVMARAARVWLKGKTPARGLDLLGRVLEKKPDHQGAHLALAEYYESIGQKARAADHRRRAGSISEKSP